MLYEIMPDVALIAASPVGDTTTAGATDRLAGLIMPLKAIIDAIPVGLPELWDGETWLYVDSAMTALYGALAALEHIDRMRHAPDQPICADITL